jgi:hypothetical protein
MSAAAKAVKVGVEARVWLPLEKICEKNGMKEHVENALITYLALLDNTLVLRHDGDYYDVVDVSQLEFEDAAGYTFEPLYGSFPSKVIKRFVHIVAPYVVKPCDGRPYKIRITVTRRRRGALVRQSEDYCCDYLYPNVIANHVYSDEPVTMEYFREEEAEDPLKELLDLRRAYFEKDYIELGVPPGFEAKERQTKHPEPPDKEVLNDSREVDAEISVDAELWNVFTGVIKYRKLDVVKSFNEALKIYLGGLWNTLAVKEYYVLDYYHELKREVVNIAYEDIEFNGAKYKPVGKGEDSPSVMVKYSFTENVIRAVVRKLGQPYAYMDIHRPLRFRRADELDEDEIVEMVLDDYMMIFQMGKYRQMALTKDCLHPTSLEIEF